MTDPIADMLAPLVDINLSSANQLAKVIRQQVGRELLDPKNEGKRCEDIIREVCKLDK